MQLGADLAEQIDYGLVRLAIFGVEPGNHVAKVRLGEASLLVDLAGQEALAERAKRNKADA